MATEKIEQLDPSKVLAEGNMRYALIPADVEQMKASIIDRGGVETPVVVEALKPAQNGFTHRLVVGFNRHQAVSELNKADKTLGLTLPAIVRPAGDEKERFLTQVSENVIRASLSPMDTAVAIKKALDLGLSKADVRNLFKIKGGKKGNELTPMSNAYLNIHLQFLDLPKAIQAKIHDGRLHIGAAYQLTKVPAEQREAILKRAEELRLKAYEKDVKAEEREAAAEQTEAEREAKAAEKAAKVAEAEAAVATAETEMDRLEGLFTEAKAAHIAAATPMPGHTLKESEGGPSEADKKAWAEKNIAAKQARRDAEKALGDHKKVLDKARRALTALQPKAKDESETEEAPAEEKVPAKPSKAKQTATEKDVKKASAEAGVSKTVALNAGEARAAVSELGNSKFKVVAEIAGLFAALLAGTLVPKEVETRLSVITGERKTKRA